MDEIKEAKRKGYPAEMYVSYARSVSLAMERRLLDLVPENDYVFWEWFIDEVNIGRERMRVISRTVREGKTLKSNRPVSRPIRTGKRNEVHALVSKEIAEEI